MVMMITLYSLLRQEGLREKRRKKKRREKRRKKKRRERRSSGRRGGRGGRPKKGGSNRNSDPRHERSHWYSSVRGVRCEEKKKNMEGGVGFHSTGRTERARDWLHPLTIGMNGATEQ